MQNQSKVPFQFAELMPQAQDEASPRRFTQDDLEQARNEGVAAGRKLAMETLEASKCTALDSIAASLSCLVSEHRQTTLLAHRATLEAIQGFLEIFHENLLSQREARAVITLLDDVVFPDTLLSSIILKMNPKSITREGVDIEHMLNASKTISSYSFDPDPSLQHGEIKIEWANGGISATKDDARVAIETLIEKMNADFDAAGENES